MLIPNTTDSTTLSYLMQGLQYMLGNDTLAIDYKEAAKLLKKAADEEEYTAQFFLARIYEKGGYGVQQNIQKAFHWYEKSANNGLAEAMCAYALLIMKNEGNPSNYKKGVGLFQKAAEQGNLNGMFGLGYMYLKGLGIEQDYNKSFNLFYNASKEQHVASIHFLGYCYEYGFGVEKNMENAVYCYEFAAAQGYQQSIVRLDELKNADLKSVALLNASLHAEFEQQKLIPERCNIMHQSDLTTSEMLEGTWEGILYTYDWSGQQIIEKQQVQLEMDKVETYYYLSLDADFTHTQGEVYFDATGAYFDGLELKVKDSFGEFVDQRFLSMKFELLQQNGQNYWIGKVESFVDRHQEPGAPAIIVLKLKSGATATSFQSTELQRHEGLHLMIFPNPFNHTLNVNFELHESSQVAITLYTTDGKKIKSLVENQPMEAGSHQLTFNEELPKGIYLLDFAYGKEHHVQRIIKN